MDFDKFFKVVNDQKIWEALLKAATADTTCGNSRFNWQGCSVQWSKE